MMTAEEYLEKMKDPLWYGEQDENGVDLSIIRSNLERTPTERLRSANYAALGMVRLRANVKLVTASKS